MVEWRLHPAYSFKYVKYGLLLCVIPIVQAVIAWDIESAFAAVRQNLVILVSMAVAALILWSRTSLSFNEREICIREGLFLRRETVLQRDMLTAITIERPMRYRLTGGSKVRFYLRSPSSPSAVAVPLSKTRARVVAELFMPRRGTPVSFRPSGGEWLNYLMLSVDVVTGVVFGVMAVQRMTRIFGEEFKETAMQGLLTAEHVVQFFVPAGAAVAVTLLLLVYGLALGRSIFQASDFQVKRYGDVIVTTGGLLTKRENRIFLSEITSTEVRVTWPARVLRRVPVYVNAGGYREKDLPVMLYHKGNLTKVKQLLPGFVSPFLSYCKSPKGKSFLQYMWPPLAMLGVFGAAIGLCQNLLPGMVPILLLPLFLALVYLLISAEGIAKEGVRRNPEGSISLSCAGFLNRRIVTVYTADVFLRVTTSTTGQLAGRCSLRLKTRDRLNCYVRGVPVSEARSILPLASEAAPELHLYRA